MVTMAKQRSLPRYAGIVVVVYAIIVYAEMPALAIGHRIVGVYGVNLRCLFETVSIYIHERDTSSVYLCYAIMALRYATAPGDDTRLAVIKKAPLPRYMMMKARLALRYLVTRDEDIG